MRVIACEQGSSDWHAARRGLPTASGFARIVTAKTLAPSAQADKYLADLLVETFFPPPPGADEAPGSGLMHRGTSMEAEAADAYAFEHGGDVQVVGFCLRDDERAGASPDRLVGDDGLLEIKCKGAVGHILAVLDGGVAALADHRLQVQGELWVTGRAWCDLYLYHPDLPTIRHRVTPDLDVFAAFDAHIPAFCDRLDAAMERLKTLGVLLPGEQPEPDLIPAWPEAEDMAP